MRTFGYRGFIAGALFAVVSVAVFAVDMPALPHYLLTARGLVVLLWALWAFRPDD